MSHLVLVHSSDLHIDGEHGEGDGTARLKSVLHHARSIRADIVLLAGDTFDHSRVPAPVLARVRDLLRDAGLPVVILPGNHDPALPNSVFVRGGLELLENVSVLGVTHDSAVLLPGHGLEVWGEAHRDYNDMAPLRTPPPRRTRWQVAMGHGHYETPENLATPLRPSWLFSDPEIAATRADYLALGHWDRPMRVGCGAVPAYYSGSPDLAKTVNVIRLGEGVHVTREAIRG